MSMILQLTPHDPLVARDGRPFGAKQGQRMRGLPWILPSVVAGSFRTALVKATSGLDYSGDIPQRLLQIDVAGVFPTHGGQLYLPAPGDVVAEPGENGNTIKTIHRVLPQTVYGGCDLPLEGLQPVMLSETQARDDFKPAAVPSWWPVQQYIEWLQNKNVNFDPSFLNSPHQEIRDHVCLDAERGAAAKSLIFATTGLNVSYLPRFGVRWDEKPIPFDQRFAEVTLSARIRVPDSETQIRLQDQFQIWHPLGGERRMAHWKHEDKPTSGWQCPVAIRSGLASSNRVRMILATPAIFADGWKPGWLNNGGEGELFGVKLKLVGVTNGRWKAVSGWSLQPHKETGRPGPKPIRRMVPAGSVYFFTIVEGDANHLADHWLESVSDEEQERRDGFGLALWGIW